MFSCDDRERTVAMEAPRMIQWVGEGTLLLTRRRVVDQ